MTKTQKPTSAPQNPSDVTVKSKQDAKVKQEQLNKAYADLCTKLGDVEYNITLYRRQALKLQEQIDKLNELSLKLKEEENEDKN